MSRILDSLTRRSIAIGLGCLLSIAPAALAEPLAPQPSYRETTKAVASDGSANSFFGISMDIDGDTAVIGATGAGPGGRVYLFQRQPGGGPWLELTTLESSDIGTNDGFGIGVAISGDTVVVGAWEDDDGGGESGSAYVFERDAGGPDAWGEVAKLTAGDATPNARFGFSVSVSGDAAAVGAYRAGPAGAETGAVYIYERDAGGPDAWAQTARVTADDATPIDHFGMAVGLSGDTLAVGSRLDDDLGFNSGSAYVFERDRGGADNWDQTAKLLAMDGKALDRFGRVIAIDGDTVVVGAPADGTGEGWAYVYERDAGGADAWQQTAKLVGPDSAFDDWFAGAIDISGDVIVSGADDHDFLGMDSGAGYVYHRDAGGPGAWGKVAKIVGHDTAEGDQLGRAAAVSGGTVIIGADLDDDLGEKSGSTYFFDEIVVDPQLVVVGDCPGEMTIIAAGMTPQRALGLYGSETEGPFTMGGGACLGTELGLDGATPIGPRITDELGMTSLTATLGQAWCGIKLQVVDSVSCAVSNVTTIPAD